MDLWLIGYRLKQLEREPFKDMNPPPGNIIERWIENYHRRHHERNHDRKVKEFWRSRAGVGVRRRLERAVGKIDLPPEAVITQELADELMFKASGQVRYRVPGKSGEFNVPKVPTVPSERQAYFMELLRRVAEREPWAREIYERRLREIERAKQPPTPEQLKRRAEFKEAQMRARAIETDLGMEEYLRYQREQAAGR